jgi:hypothetical protein
MLRCRFVLNGKPMSDLQAGAASYAAFSGLGEYANRPEYSCVKSTGPIPRGAYYIVDRQQGGRLAPLRELFSGDKRHWFALYAADGAVDDETFCSQVKRGGFRLHPKGPLGRSEGCITIEQQADFQQLRAQLLCSAMSKISGSALLAYGMVTVQ